VLVRFHGADGYASYAGLIADAAGNLFGTTAGNGVHDNGTVFEIAKTATGYAKKPTVLVRFDGTDGSFPSAGLIADAAGNLFGTTTLGGANREGTVFELAKTATGYAKKPTVLVRFHGADGYASYAGLIADAAGNLFGTTSGGGVLESGTVFEIVKTASGYASTPTVLVSFGHIDGALPFASLIADAAGNLFGTTSAGGVNENGTVFEVRGSGFVAFAGTPGAPNCFGATVSALAQKYGGLRPAAAALGYSSVPVLRQAITTFCAR
jgi:hypothetical protein